MKRQLGILLAMTMTVGCLGGCSQTATASQDAVSVQTVASLLGYDLSGNNRFTGIVESRATQKIAKETDRTISEVYVAVGDEVKKGEVLFSYDKESMQLAVETAQLEAEQLQNNIDSYDDQIVQLTKEKGSASSSDKLSYNIQIQEAQLSKSEDQYNLKKKQAELKKLEKELANVDVKATVNGMVQSINDGTDTSYDSSSDGTYMTILETGVFQVKGTANETNVSSLYQGEPVTVKSRVDDTTWAGEIKEVNTGNTQEESDDSGVVYSSDGGDSGSSESASKYSFTVTLNDSEGLMMGQHVYIEPGVAVDANSIAMYSFYIVQDDTGAYVWAANGQDKLEKRAVTLGEYDEMTDTYAITDGLTLEDEIAYPDDTLKEGAAVTLFDASSFEAVDDGSGNGEMLVDDGSGDGEMLVNDGSGTDGEAVVAETEAGGEEK